MIFIRATANYAGAEKLRLFSCSPAVAGVGARATYSIAGRVGDPSLHGQGAGPLGGEVFVGWGWKAIRQAIGDFGEHGQALDQITSQGVAAEAPAEITL